MNTAAYYQRCVITCETVAVFHRRPFWQHLACCSANSMHLTGSESWFLPTPPAFYAPVRRVHVAILLCRSAWKTRMLCLTDSEKISKMSLFVLTRSTNVTDTHTPHDGTGGAILQSIAWQKSFDFDEIWYTTSDIKPDDSHVTKNWNF